MERLQKVIARAGVTSRRHAEELIRQGRVRVNGQIVTRLGTQVTPGVDRILVDGEPIGPAEPGVYLIINKPRGYLTTLHDPQGRPTVADLLPNLGVRLFPVGRLDYDTEGLLIFTTDGDAAFALTHPSFEIPRCYHAVVQGNPGEETLDRLRRGIRLADGPVKADEIKRLGSKGINTLVEVWLHEGRKREVRRMFEAVGHPVSSLVRVSFGPMRLGGLKPGEFRYLTPEEEAWIRGVAREWARLREG